MNEALKYLIEHMAQLIGVNMVDNNSKAHLWESALVQPIPMIKAKQQFV